LIALSAALLLFAPAAQAQTPLAPGEIARVADQPILKTEYDHWMEIARRSPSSGDEETRGQQIVQVLISFRWLEGEAVRLGIVVPPAAVNREFRSQKRQAFPKPGQFRRFLRESGQTLADIKRRVRLDMLSNRLRDRAVRGAKTPRGQMRRLDRYVERFNARWKAKTICLEGYGSEYECGTVVPPPA